MSLLCSKDRDRPGHNPSHVLFLQPCHINKHQFSLISLNSPLNFLKLLLDHVSEQPQGPPKTICVYRCVCCHQACIPYTFHLNAYYPHLRQPSSRTNPSALLAVNMLPFIDVKMLDLPTLFLLSPSLKPVPGVPITHGASNPTWAFLNFRGTLTDESIDLWLADGPWRGGGFEGGR